MLVSFQVFPQKGAGTCPKLHSTRILFTFTQSMDETLLLGDRLFVV